MDIVDVMGVSGFTTARLDVAPLATADADELGALDDARLHTFTNDEPLGAAGWRSRAALLVAAAQRTEGDRWLTWTLRRRDDGEAVGFLQATVARDRGAAELAWVVGAEHQGRGLAREAAEGMVAWLAARGVTELAATIAPGHTASEGVAAHLGLTVTDEVRDGERLWRRPGVSGVAQGQDRAMAAPPTGHPR